MRLTLNTPEKSLPMTGGILCLVAFNIFYFTIVLSPSSIWIPALFWAAYACWAGAGCIMMLRDMYSQKKKLRHTYMVFILIILFTAAITVMDRILLLTLLAFPGYYVGAGAAGILILGYRAITHKGPVTEDFLQPP